MYTSRLRRRIDRSILGISAAILLTIGLPVGLRAQPNCPQVTFLTAQKRLYANGELTFSVLDTDHYIGWRVGGSAPFPFRGRNDAFEDTLIPCVPRRSASHSTT